MLHTLMYVGIFGAALRAKGPSRPEVRARGEGPSRPEAAARAERHH